MLHSIYATRHRTRIDLKCGLAWIADWPEWHFWVIGLIVIQVNPESLHPDWLAWRIDHKTHLFIGTKRYKIWVKNLYDQSTLGSRSILNSGQSGVDLIRLAIRNFFIIEGTWSRRGTSNPARSSSRTSRSPSGPTRPSGSSAPRASERFVFWWMEPMLTVWPDI